MVSHKLHVHVGLTWTANESGMVTLTFDLLTLKVVSESRVMWATSVPISVFLGISVLDLGPIYATDRRQTSSDVRRASSLNASALTGRGYNKWMNEIHTITACDEDRFIGGGDSRCLSAGGDSALLVHSWGVMCKWSVIANNRLCSLASWQQNILSR